MPIGTSDGQYYEHELDYTLASNNQFKTPLQGPQMAAGEFNPISSGKVAPEEKASLRASNEAQGPVIDRSKDVPLAASALHKDGQFYGIAIDKDAPEPPHPAFHAGVYLHEFSEFQHMKNLIDSGMSHQDAYHEAHDKIATPTETAFIRATAAREGKDPELFLDQYKQYWRMVAGQAAEGPHDRHEDAHTTTFGLDQSELPDQRAAFDADLKREMQQAREPAKDLKDKQNKGATLLMGMAVRAGENVYDHIKQFMNSPEFAPKDTVPVARDFLQMGPVGAVEGAAGIFGGRLGMQTGKIIDYAKRLFEEGKTGKEVYERTGVFTGPEGLPRAEFSDEGARLKTDKLDEMDFSKRKREEKKHWTSVDNTTEGRYFHSPKGNLKLGDILDHPELYKNYPWLMDTPVGSTGFNFGSKGWYDTKSGHIAIAGAEENEMLSTILHEVQHKIQHEEGFARGSNPTQHYENKELTDKLSDETKETEKSLENYWNKNIVLKLPEELRKESYSPMAAEMAYNSLFKRGYDKIWARDKNLIDYLEKNHPEFHEISKTLAEAKIEQEKIQDQAVEEYRKMFGEVESRMTQNRIKMNDLSRRVNEPWNNPVFKEAHPLGGVDKTGQIEGVPSKYVQKQEGGSFQMAANRVSSVASKHDQMVDLLKQGKSYSQVAKEIGSTKSTVQNYLEGRGIYSQKKVGRQPEHDISYLDSHLEEIRKDVQSGMSGKQLRDKYGPLVGRQIGRTTMTDYVRIRDLKKKYNTAHVPPNRQQPSLPKLNLPEAYKD